MRKCISILMIALLCPLYFGGCSDSDSGGNNNSNINENINNNSNENNNGTDECSPSNCAGCCNGDVCEEGNADDMCGTEGLDCQKCSVDSSCINGKCVAPCGPDSCSGCCDDEGNCVGGATDEACGTNGELCVQCESDEACSNNSCVSLSCSDSCDGCCSGDTCLGGNSSGACGWGGASCQDCGTGRICEDQECIVDPTSRWDVILVSAEVPLYDENGDPWDSFGGLPDPYVVFEAGGMDEPEVQGESSVKTDTVSATWNEAVLENIPARTLFDWLWFKVLDTDSLNADDEMSMWISVIPSDSDFSDTLITSQEGEIIVRYRIRPH